MQSKTGGIREPLFSVIVVYNINRLKLFLIMKEQEINERQSIEIITAMIAQTKQRLHIGDGNIMLMWGYLTVSVSILVGTLLFVTGNQVWNWLWFLIFVIGGITSPVMAKRQKAKVGFKTFTDRLSNGIWSLVGWTGTFSTLVCLALFLFAGKDSWRIMLVFALLTVGIIEAVQGMIIKEKSLVCGGAAGMAAGIVTMACIAAAIPLYLCWYMPMFAAAWVCMMIIPGHILNHKAKARLSK